MIGNPISAPAMAMLAFAHRQVREVCLANAILGVGTGLVLACLAT